MKTLACLLVATLLAAPISARADAVQHAQDDTFAAEAQALAPLVLGPTDPPPPPGINDTMGVWGPVIPWTPHIPVTAAQLPDGRLLTFASNQRTTFPGGTEFTFAATWNPATGAFVEYNHPSHDMFCGGTAMLPDGRVLVNGGRNEVVRASIFDYRTNQWTRIQDMNGGRWYNTSVALPDGQVWTVTGNGTGMTTAERWNGTTGWNILTGIPWGTVLGEPGYITRWHPFVALAPDGRLFHFGPTDIMRWITWTGSGSMTNSGNNVPGTHYPKEGSWIMYDEGKILVAGGGLNTTNNPDDTTTGTSSAAAYTVNLNTTPPTVASTASMTNPRQFANAVVLPNGEVLVMGGNTTGLKFNDTGSVFAAEIWNPTTGLWRTVASSSVPRNYHSLAVLLPDGRVLSGGGGLGGNAADHRDAQLYTPPQLFNPDGTPVTRPVLSAAPTQIGVGAIFGVTGTAGLSKFAFIKMSSITHSMNTDLRHLSLPFTETSAGNYAVSAHSNLNVMTPGYWMLFGVLPSGNYSVAKIVQVDATGSVSLANPGNQATILNAPASLQLVSSGPIGVPRTYSATGLPPGLTIGAGTGLISGAATATGPYNVRATVTGGATSSFQDFTWTVAPPTFTQNFPTFPNSTGFRLNGSATVVSNVLRLTPNTGSLVGSAYLTTPVLVGANTSFTTRFVFREHGSADGADGMAFVVQGIGDNALGTAGGGLGYGGVQRSLAIESDAFQGTGDPSGNHLGIVVNGDTTVHTQSHTPAFDLESGTSHTAWVEYDGPANTLRVYLAQGIVTTRPASPVMTATNLDLATITNGLAWFGFSGATGGSSNNHDVEAWSLTVNANALPTPPVVTNPGNQSSGLGAGVSLQIQASDVNGDLLTYSATGLPAGLSIGASTGLISGTASAAGTSNVVVTVNDGVSTPVTAAFTWTVSGTLEVLPLVGGPVVSGSSVTFTGQASGGVNPQYKWTFGDGTPETAFSSAPGISHTYSAPGRYQVTLTVRDSTGAEVTTSFHQAIHAVLTARKPTHSSTIVFEDRAGANDRVWCVNPDNNSVAVFDTQTRARLAEINVGNAPRTLAVAPDGRVWVVNAGASTLNIINSTTFAVAATVNLPRAAQPYGLAFDPDGTDAWVACEATGQLLRLNPANGAQLASIAVGPHVRHVSVSADSARVFVSRFVTPPLPSEGTASPQTEVAGVKYGGEIVVVNAAAGAIDRTIVLQHSEEPDTAASARGIPNYVGAVTISPDGLSAWIPSKQDNIKRGTLRNGQPLTHDMAMRSIASRLALNAGVPATDDLANRVDFDNAGIASASAFDSKGVYLFTALEGSRSVAVVDAWSGTELFRIEARRAPQGLVLAPDDRTLYVHNFMSRSITVYYMGRIMDGTEAAPPISDTLSCVTTDLLSATVLKGKQLFYDTKEEEVALQEYVSCAACHNDGGQDGRVWDFTQFGEGLRDTILLRGRGGMAHGPLHWTGNFDEVQDFEGQIRNFAGGTGLMANFHFNDGTRSQPLGDLKAGKSADLDALAAYVTSLGQAGSSPNRNADGSLTAAAVAGEAVFRQMNCANCHSGTTFTDSALGVFRNVGTLKPSSGQRLGAPLTGLDTPTLRGLWNTAPYLHDGSAATVSDAITAHTGVSLNATDLAHLAAFLQQIDDAVLTAPVETSPPIVTLTGPGSSVTSAFNVTANFSKTVTGLIAGDFVVTNGTLSAFTGSAAAYSFTITPLAGGAVTVNLPTNACMDLAGLGNVASNTLSITYVPPSGDVNGLTGRYYSGSNFQTLVLTRIDPTINFNWGNGSPAAAVPANSFSARWTGQVTPLYSQTYTFFLTADDGMRLWVNNQLLVDDWVSPSLSTQSGTIALTAGVPVDIRVDYFESRKGAYVSLEWRSTSQVREIIPTSRLTTPPLPPAPPSQTLSATRLLVSRTSPAPTTTVRTAAKATPPSIRAVTRGTSAVVPVRNSTTSVSSPDRGLRGEYFSGDNFNTFGMARTDDQVDFYWSESAPPVPGVPANGYSVRWLGRLRPMYSEEYTFFLATDEGVRLWVNGELLVNRWAPGTSGASELAGISVFLRAGQFYDLRLEFQNTAQDGWVELKWESESQPREVIPASRLFPPQ